MTEHNHAYPPRPLYGLIARVLDSDPYDLELAEQTLTLLARIRDHEPDRREKRYLQSFISRLLVVRDLSEGRGLILRA